MLFVRMWHTSPECLQSSGARYFYQWLEKHGIEFKAEGEMPMKIVTQITMDEKKFLELMLRSNG